MLDVSNYQDIEPKGNTMTWLNKHDDSRDSARQAVTARGRGSRRLVTTLAAVLSAVLLVANPAAAARPQVVEDFTTDETLTLPAAESPCGVEMTSHQVATWRITEFFDKDGNLVRAQGHGHGTTTITSAHGQLWERWAVSAVLDPEAGTLTWSGNGFNIHGSAGGILANVSGRWVEDFQTGELITVLAGPHEDPDLDPDVLAALCAELTP